MHLRSIQVLRAVAALLVVAFHLFPGRFVIGAAGVDIFFVISGFIMGTIGPGETPRTFMVKRAVRIVPLYWAVTLAMCAASLVPGLFASFTFDAARLVQSLLFIPHVDPNGMIWPLVVVGWTLNFEVFFYAIFAIGLFIGRPIAFSVVLMAVLAGIGSAIAAAMIEVPAPVKVWTDILLLEFAAGLILATLTSLKGAGRGLCLLLLGTGGLVLSSVFALFEPSERLWAWGVPALLIVAGCLAIERAGAWPRFLRPLEIVGDASYSLYLLHGLVIAFVHKLLGTGIVATLVILPVSLVIALASYRLFEKPVARWLRPRPARAVSGANRDG